MTHSPADATLLATLQSRLSTLLPDTYQSPDEDIQPVSMGSAALKFNPDGTVAWNDIWGSFCHLAMAGGPPHKGTLLEAATQAQIDANPGRHRQVLEELCRAIPLVTRLEAEPSRTPGWVRVDCPSEAMAGWLTRAIVMENVSAHCAGSVLSLPAGPAYRLEKEIKNVVTVIAKTCHYWRDHTTPARQQTIANLLARMNRESPLIQPPFPAEQSSPSQHTLSRNIAEAIHHATALEMTTHRYTGWLGLNCQTIPAAISIMRLLVAANLLSRREEATVFLPINPATDPNGKIVLEASIRTHRLVTSKALR